MGWTHLLSSCPKHSTFRADDLGPYVPRKDQISTAAFHTAHFFVCQSFANQPKKWKCYTVKPGHNEPQFSEFRDIVNQTQLPF